MAFRIPDARYCYFLGRALQRLLAPGVKPMPDEIAIVPVSADDA